MNRVIKFRGKRVDNGQWIFGYYLSDESMTMKHVIYTSGLPYNSHIEVDPSTVGQFTGLLDKDGKEIYEGDLLHRHMNVYWKVEFSDSQWKANGAKDHTGLYLSAYQFVEAQIIGNIHDNPELLK